jgi:FlgN protein
MSLPLLSQLELVLRQLLQEHHVLLRHLDAHEAALRTAKLELIEKAAREQDFVRQRISQIETRRRQLMHQIARQQKATQPLTLASLAQMFPERKLVLIQMRSELADLLAQIQMKSALVGKIAQAVLGHVSATLRLVASAAAGPGGYTKNGSTPMPTRIGVLNAVA